MFVTLEVSQLDISALKSFKSLKSPLMSVMAETSQSARGPYVAMAESALASYASTAVFRWVLLVKTLSIAGGGGDCGGDGGGGGGLGDGGDGGGDGQLPEPQLEP
eukprot:scaffold92250_cov61-Phaeocystis_antarctica.AAC.7